ncbi:MAG: GlsB/YeaQ/YmgE family stress response membrane protein [Saprospiraceae bacterium]|nr:GlsB/YeaQ/YmgE family stress response membrane protein [Saprospiraceae bacterium]MCB0543945.1 GlsB/YeaQ/YmgE family stress response membrane protein [Saprospiraceae bacterium]MCB0575092.1 GlsB/YeaQ/YmgE family stress response membrane protein [Saprospiraceae bacterium]MCB9308246.1 GlsB/YeaQ/YmgE family stress response membrane protein [Lewinellaceae bacterium]MCB9355797.1 GlsB/YeaQ/YmgE family stress response membrane protein [Lewinellaceae bacterium]
MDLSTLLVILAIGAASGWLAGFIRQGYGFGLLGNIVIGIIGSYIGSWLLGEIGLSLGTGLLSTIAKSVIGALVLLFLIGLIKKSK